jgi:hypothetical protein
MTNGLIEKIRGLRQTERQKAQAEYRRLLHDPEGADFRKLEKFLGPLGKTVEDLQVDIEAINRAADLQVKLDNADLPALQAAAVATGAEYGELDRTFQKKVDDFAAQLQSEKATAFSRWNVARAAVSVVINGQKQLAGLKTSHSDLFEEAKNE